MRFLVAVAAIFLALAPVACGDGDGDSTDEALEAKVQAYLAGPKIDPPDRPPPKKLTIKDLKIGSGPVAERGDKVTIHYIGVVYKNDRVLSRRWEPDPPVVYPRLGVGGYDGLERGIEGMREGGRREMVIPGYPTLGAVIYVVDMEKVEPGARSRSG